MNRLANRYTAYTHPHTYTHTHVEIKREQEEKKTRVLKEIAYENKNTVFI